MTHLSPSAGIAKLAVISDFPIDDQLMRVVRQLWGENTTEGDLVFGINRKWCEWPCRVPYEGGSVGDLGFHIYLCAGFLSQRRKIVERIHQLGCNLEISMHVTGLPDYLSLAAGTMQQLADLDIQLSFRRDVGAEASACATGG